MDLLNNLKWRYATKKMNGQTIPQEKLDYILEAARFAPSSSGLQPYRIYVISDRKQLEQIREFAYDQSQITECSHLLVWAAWDGYSADRVGEVLVNTSRERGLPEEGAEEYKNMLLESFEPMGKEG